MYVIYLLMRNYFDAHAFPLCLRSGRLQIHCFVNTMAYSVFDSLFLFNFHFIFISRAIKRFNIAIRTDATYVRAYLCRAEAYEKIYKVLQSAALF